MGYGVCRSTLLLPGTLHCMTDETHSLPADFGGGIAPSSHGVIANNAIEGANGYGVWVNARGQHSAKFPDGSAGPTVGAVRPVFGCEA